MKNIVKYLTLVLITLGLITTTDSCKEQTESALAILTTENASVITQTDAVSGGEISDDGGANVTARGVCWGTATKPVVSGAHTTDGSGSGTFVSNIIGLTAGTLYYVRAYATNSVGTAYGNEVSFTTTSGSLATLTTTVVSAITSTTAVSGGDITDDNGSDISARGVCWSTSTNPTVADSHTSDGTGKGIFVSNMSGLTAGTLYYVRAYATNSVGTAYGNEVTFTTTSVSLATLTTTAISAITTTTAVSGGNITDDNGSDITARGVCWNTTTGPTVAGSHTTDGTGTGIFASSISALTAGTMYYVRAYATNSAGTAYGNEVSFTTTSISLATLTTTAISSITTTTAVSGGNITDDNGSNITARGVCWSTTAGPTVAGSHTTDGTGTGVFASSISALTAGTMYYVRAYATNGAGTAYGNEVSFTTTASVSLATLTTDAISSIAATTAISGGNITDDNGSNITARGVCWSTSQNPTIAGSHTTDGSGDGMFVSNISGLTAGTMYYVRAYATNGAGTAYGNEVSFTTIAGPGVNEVWIQGRAFNPASITVAAGTTITWTNKDGVNHTVTSTTALFDSGTINNNGTYSHTFNTAGTFPYTCTIHPDMAGTVIVN